MAVSRRIGARRRIARLVAAATTPLLVFSVAGKAQAVALSGLRSPGYCSSAHHPALAARLSQDIASALSGRQDTVAFGVWDAKTGVSCAYHASRHFDSASVVKVTIMGAVLRRAEEGQRSLTDWERSNLRAMITASDNTAASNLWRSLGMSRLGAFLRLAGMNNTVLGDGGYWGLTQITAADELKVLDVFTGNPGVLTPAGKAYGLRLMSEVEADQRWGTPYGAPAGISVHVKNGWLPRATHGWRVHSLGIFTGKGKDYRMAVLTEDNDTESYGIGTIQRIASAVHHDLNSGVNGQIAEAVPGTPDGQAPEDADGSAPFGLVRQ